MRSLIKASSVRDGHRAMRRRFGDAVFDEAISRLSAEDRSQIAALGTLTMYPLAADGRLQQHLADIACEGSRPLIDRMFRGAAGIQADDMLNGVFCTSRERAASAGGPLGYLTEKYRHDEVVFA